MGQEDSLPVPQDPPIPRNITSLKIPVPSAIDGSEVSSLQLELVILGIHGEEVRVEMKLD